MFHVSFYCHLLIQIYSRSQMVLYVPFRRLTYHSINTFLWPSHCNLFENHGSIESIFWHRHSLLEHCSLFVASGALLQCNTWCHHPQYHSLSWAKIWKYSKSHCNIIGDVTTIIALDIICYIENVSAANLKCRFYYQLIWPANSVSGDLSSVHFTSNLPFTGRYQLSTRHR